MPRKLRYVPKKGSLVEITCRTLGAEFLLRPCATVNELVLGIVGRAQRLNSMKICSMIFMSNGYHLLLHVRDAGQLADFMGFVNSNISKEMNALLERKGPFWERRYDAILVSDEEAAQVARLHYQLRHGVKENLVEDPRLWPGIQSAEILCGEGDELSGYWFDRTKEGRARRRGRSFDRLAYAEKETVYLSPLPCWEKQGLEPAEIMATIQGLIEEVIAEGKAVRKLDKKRALGREAVLAMPTDTRPRAPKRSPAPRFHFATHDAYEELLEGYKAFALAYYPASLAYRQGDRNAVFPENCFPPRRPFFTGPVPGA